MNGKDVEVVGECVHLGIHRVSKSRYTKMLTNAFSLPGGALNCRKDARLYTGKVGIILCFPLQCGFFFILPCLLYGLDILTLIKVIENNEEESYQLKSQITLLKPKQEIKKYYR